jgi:hypothetical protein
MRMDVLSAPARIRAVVCGWGALAACALASCTPIRGTEPDVVDAAIAPDVVDTFVSPAPIGTRCSSNRNCGAGQFCNADPGGFCTKSCSSSDECGPDGVCTRPAGICWKRCVTEVDCGDGGWICVQISGSASGRCVPACTSAPGATCGAFGCLVNVDACVSTCSVVGSNSVGCSAGSVCSNGTCRCTSSTDCGANRRCDNGSCVYID